MDYIKLKPEEIKVGKSVLYYDDDEMRYILSKIKVVREFEVLLEDIDVNSLDIGMTWISNLSEFDEDINTPYFSGPIIAKLPKELSEERLEDAAHEAEHSFWKTVSSFIPEIANGDWPPAQSIEFNNVLKKTIKEWYIQNRKEI